MSIKRSHKEIKEREEAVKVNKILTPGESLTTHEFNTLDGKTFFVVEVKGCMFEGYQVCLSTKEILRIPRMHAIKKKMYDFWEKLAGKGGGAHKGIIGEG